MYEKVGFIHTHTKDLWNGHPCCAFGTTAEFIRKNPNTFAALYRAVLTAAAMARDPKNRELIAKVIAPAQYRNQPEAVLNQVLTGKFSDGLGNIKTVPGRADSDPMPWQSMAVWMLTQMKRWEYVNAVTTDPLIYRWYEIVSVYGTTIKEHTHEEFGDGIMSAIDFSMGIVRQPDPKGDRVNVALSGKFLPYKQY